MIPRSYFPTLGRGYEIDEEKYRRFPVHKQAFATVGKEDTGQDGLFLSLEKMWAKMAAKIAGNKPGYTRLDYALDIGANAMNMALGTYGFPNSQMLKWEPLFVPQPLLGNPVRLSPQELTSMVKGAAKLYGSDLVGIATLDKRWVYSEDLFKPFVFEAEGRPRETEDSFILPETVNRAVIMAVAMDPELSAGSPEVAASTAASLGYSRMAILAVSLAEYIRALGYTAIPCMNDTALSIPLAVDAGLGELGRHGLLITPEFGPCIRLCKVLTDMPLVSDGPVDFGIADFCRQCLLCARHCPPQAISYKGQSFDGVCENNNPGVKKWFIDATACLRFWQFNGASCANCISVCPFYRGFEAPQCLECVRCDTTSGCSLQYITHLRKKFGYLDYSNWGEDPDWLPLTRKGL